MTAMQRDAGHIVERVVIEGDLSKLTPAERVAYYRQVCESIGVNPLTRPFDYIVLNGRLTLYARKDCTDQLRKRDGVSITALETQVISDVYIVKTQARTPDGRTDIATGAVSIKNLSGEALANAMLKAETKSKRRVTLSICGLGMLDESEIEATGAQPVAVDAQTGEIKPVSGNGHKVADLSMLLADYVKTDRGRASFWGQVKTKLGLSEEEVHAALGVQHLVEYAGTLGQAVDQLKRYALSKPSMSEPGQADEGDV